MARSRRTARRPRTPRDIGYLTERQLGELRRAARAHIAAHRRCLAHDRDSVTESVYSWPHGTLAPVVFLSMGLELDAVAVRLARQAEDVNVGERATRAATGRTSAGRPAAGAASASRPPRRCRIRPDGDPSGARESLGG